MITFETKTTVEVRLEGKKIGEIRRDKQKFWRYHPGSQARCFGDPFLKLEDCKRTVAGDEPWKDV